MNVNVFCSLSCVLSGCLILGSDSYSSIALWKSVIRFIYLDQMLAASAFSRLRPRITNQM